MNNTTKKTLAAVFVFVILAAILVYCSPAANANEECAPEDWACQGFTVAPVHHETVVVEQWETKCSPTLLEELNVLQDRDEYHVDYIYELENRNRELQADLSYSDREVIRQAAVIKRLRAKLRRR